MTYEEVQNYIATPNVYADVTSDQIAALTVANYVTAIGGITYVGTYDLVPDLSANQLLPSLDNSDQIQAP